MATRTLEVQITGDPSKFNRSLGHVDTSVDKTSGKFKRLGDVGKRAFLGLQVAAGSAALVGLKEVVGAASDIEESLSKNQVLFGKYATDLDQFSQRSASAFGISRKAALEYTGTFGNLFRSMGTSQEKSAQFSKGLTKLAADMASFNNTSISDALEAIRSGLVGESEPLRRFGVNLNDMTLRNEALKKGLIETTKDALTPQQKALATQSLLYKQTSKAQGDFHRTSGGLANQQKILMARFQDAAAALGTKLLPFATKALKAFNDMFDGQSKGVRVLKRVSDAYMDWLQIVRDVVRKVANAVGNWVDKNREQINDVIRAFKRIGNFIKDIVLEVIIPMIKKIAPVVKDFVETSLRHFGRMVELVTDLINGDWADAWDKFKEIVVELLKSIPRIMGRLLTLFGDGFKALTKKINKAGEDLGNALIKGMKDGIKEHGEDIAKTILDYVPTPENLVDLGSKIGKKLTGDGVGWAPIPTTGGVGPSSLMGADAALGPFAAIAAKFGLSVTSGSRPGSITSSGNLSLHSTGDAIDVSNGYSTPQELAFFNFMKKNYGSQLAELIYTPGGAGIKNGQSYTFTGQVAADHYDHVHVGYTGGIGDGIGHTSGMSGKGRKPRTGDGAGIKGIDFSPAQIKFAVAAAGASGLDPRVIAAWMNREFNGYRKTDTRGKYNFMSVGYTDSGDMGWLGNAVNDPTTAGRATGLWLTGKLKGAPKAAAGIQAIADTAGGSIRSQVKAIIDSPWASGHYFYNYGDFAASAAGISGFGKVDGGSSGAGGGGGGTAKNPARAKWEKAQEQIKAKAKDAVDAARNEALTGGGALELSIARAQTLQARATSKDDLAGLIKGLKQERDVKRRRLKRVRKLLKRKHRLGRKNRVALLNEEAQLLADIGDLNDTIKEYKADQKGGATTVSRAEELDAGVDPNAADTGDAGGGGADTSAADEAQAARDAVNAEIANLLASINANQTAIKRLAEQQGPQMVAALMAAYNGDIGAKVAGQLQTTGYYAGSGARY